MNTDTALKDASIQQLRDALAARERVMKELDDWMLSINGKILGRLQLPGGKTLQSIIHVRSVDVNGIRGEFLWRRLQNGLRSRFGSFNVQYCEEYFIPKTELIDRSLFVVVDHSEAANFLESLTARMEGILDRHDDE